MERHPELSQPKTPAHYLRILFTGFAMGAADIVPGVSGGTMAFIMGIYENLLDGIKSFNLTALQLLLKRDFRQLFQHIPLRFLITLGLGIGIAILSLANILGTYMETAPTYVYAFFGGLVLASIVAIGLKVTWTPTTIIALIVGTVGAFFLVAIEALNPDNVSHSLPVLFVSGAIAICAMILPGISGSFILLILGQYQYVLNAVRTRDIPPIIAVAAGCAVGILIFARVLSWLLKHHYQLTVALLTGFMIGSLRRVWLNAEAGLALIPDFGAQHLLFALFMLLVGFVLVSLFDHMQSGSNPLFRWFWPQPKAAEQA
jgi:putative membrane protein